MSMITFPPLRGTQENTEGGGVVPDEHITNLGNPHGVTKAQVGLSEVDNTSDVNKPVSLAQQTALNLKQNIPLEGPFADGDKTKLDTAYTNTHTHVNKEVLDAFGEDAEGLPTYNGNRIDTTIAQRDVYDGLDSTNNTISLSANQGKVLDEKKVDKVVGKQLSDENYTLVEKQKLAGIESGATADQTAEEVPYTNTASGLTATEVQSAIDELQTGKLEASLKGAANGLAELNALTRVPQIQLGDGTADNTKFLRGDGTWATPVDFGVGIGALTFYNADGSQDDIELLANTQMDFLGINNEFNMNANADFRVDSVFGWRDLFGPIEVRGGGSSPEWDVFRNGISAYYWRPTGGARSAWVNFHIDHDYAVGTKAFPHIHFAVTTTDGGNVRFGIEYTVAKGHQQASGSVFGPTTTVFVQGTVVAGGADQFKHFVIETSEADAIPATQLEPDSMILMRVFRDTGVAGNFAGNVFVFQADLHYQIGKFATPNKAPNFYGV
jgi:hypothetical protein